MHETGCRHFENTLQATNQRAEFSIFTVVIILIYNNTLTTKVNKAVIEFLQKMNN